MDSAWNPVADLEGFAEMVDLNQCDIGVEGGGYGPEQEVFGEPLKSRRWRPGGR